MKAYRMPNKNLTSFTKFSCETNWAVACITIDPIDASGIVQARVICTVIDIWNSGNIKWTIRKNICFRVLTQKKQSSEKIYIVSGQDWIHTCFTICACEAGWTVACITIYMIDTGCIVLTRVIHTIIDICSKKALSVQAAFQIGKNFFSFFFHRMHGE